MAAQEQIMTNSFGEVAERLRRSTVRISDRARGAGSGVVLSSDGTVVTNAHVARGESLSVELWDGSIHRAELVSRDRSRDLALLRIAADSLAAAPLGDSSAVRPGELVIAIGNPLGFVGALTRGVVHAVAPVRGLGRRSWVQASIRLAPGNSGGPLADAGGRVIGINTVVVAGGLGLAIPSNTVAQFYRKPDSGPSLGIVVRAVSTPAAAGLLILEIATSSPAAAASLLPGDLLIGAGGRSPLTLDDLTEVLESRPASLRLEFLRPGSSAVRRVTVRLDAAQAGVAA
jgi:serine protease Do